jgi:lipopolysaccharide transport system ATP-binding protein
MSFIKLDNVSVEYPILDVSKRSFKKDALSWITGGKLGEGNAKHVSIRALEKISLDFGAGERIGLLGHNGSGKSTLLKVIAGVYHPTKGASRTKGRITSLLDLTLGMELEATGHENIYLRGVLLGASPSEIKKTAASIGEFSGLGDYLKLPIRTYSSGMLVRLGFAISTAFPADIILMDEWLGVGDATFQAEANTRLKSMTENAAILVLASHSPQLIQENCTRCIRLEHGNVAEDYLMDLKI